MAGRNHMPGSGLNLRSNHHPLEEPRLVQPHRRLAPAEVHLIEDRIAAQSREIQTLLRDNQRLATNHVALKQDVAAAQQEIRRLSATASAVKAERDAQVREVYERSIKLEAEARSTDGLSAELDRVRADIKKLRDEREELSEKLKDIEGDTSRIRLELQQLPGLKAEIEAMQREIQQGRAAVEYERKMHSRNFKLSEAMEKHMISMACEAEKLRSELANAGKAMAAATAANSGPGHVIHQQNLEPGYGGNPLSDSYAVHQV
ncbi:hypothetical protein CDL12_29863 [Handroanthus impetiginosus]|uniref:Uncharacterized protein n=1 Tax=Handroanthus impetiginosus TaxID=429701 RepID=A0A2G9FXK3_9LAMI|nr:hypothetical protein CDL12_29863 [Handroanthus impetiginosus]